MVKLVPHGRNEVADANDERCSDGCGLSARECEGLHAQLVARAIEILMRPAPFVEAPFPWRKAA